MSFESVVKEQNELNKIWSQFQQDMDLGHDAYTRHARYLENMYLGGGKQWSGEEDKVAELEASGKPALELNLIGSSIRTLKGYQTQSRMNIRYAPRGEGDLAIAELLSKIALYELDQNKFPWIESQVFEDGIVQQRGYFDIRMDYEEDINGRIKIEALDPLDVIPDMDSRSYDPKDWNAVTIAKWIPLETIKILYPSKYKRVEQSMHSSDEIWGKDVSKEGAERNTFTLPNYKVNYLKTNKEDYFVKILEKQFYRVERRNYFYDASTDSMNPVPDTMNRTESRTYAKKLGLEIIPKTQKRIKWIVCTRDVILHDDWSPYDNYTVVPFFPVFRRGQTLGLVDNLISNQETINKVHSQILHILNTSANSGWITQEGSLVNMDDEDLEVEGSSTGLHIVYRRGYDKPEKIQPNQIPSGLKDFFSSAVQIHDRLLGISEAFRGERSNEISGIALQQRVNQTAVGLSAVIDNLFYTRNIMAKILLNLIQTFYTEERVFRIVDDKGQNQEEVVVNKETDYGTINDITAGKYDIVVSDVPTQINFQQGQLTEALEMRKYGVQIPDDEIVRLTSLTRREEISKRMSGEGNEATMKQQEMQIQALQEQIKEMSAKSENMEQDTIKKAAEIAKMIAENPAVAPIMQQIINMNPPKAVERKQLRDMEVEDELNDMEEEPQQQMLGRGTF
jgi:hypothetical protein